MRWINYLTILLLSPFNVFTQNESQKWYFGNQCGLDFSTNPPTIVASPVFNSVEGGATIADLSGNLLFYTDGVTIWNSTHAVMANGSGLLGNQSSSQSSIIIKQPGSTSIYYVFTQEEKGYVNGFRYSIVDMSLAAGTGSVTLKNVPLHTPSCEKISAVKHCNEIDIWIVTHDYNSDVFRSILLSSAGLSATPVLSSVGPVLSGMRYNSVLKISPNGKKIALPSLTTNSLDFFDFNTSTGAVSNHFTLSDISSYGCEFSPDGTKFYAGVDNIYQWDLCAGNISAIRSSSVTLFLNSMVAMTSFQLAPNGKIYISTLQQNALAVIDSPNLTGAASNFILAGQSVGTGTATMGLPNFLVNYFKTIPTFSVAQNCVVVTFTAPPLVNADCGAMQSYTASSWHFSDPASGVANTSTLSTVTHTFSGPGIYNVKLLLYKECSVDTISQNVSINAASSVSVLSSGSVCAGSSVTMYANGADAYLWSTGANTSSLTVFPLATSVYTVTGFFSNGCVASTTLAINVKSLTQPSIDFVYKSPLCKHDNNPLPEFNSSFSTGGVFYSPELLVDANTGLIDLTASGLGTFVIMYSVQAQNCFTAGSRTTSIIIREAPSLTVSPDVRIAPGKTAVLAVKGGTSYNWSPGTSISCTDCSDPEVSPQINTVYCVTSSELGCAATSCIYVEVTCDNGGDLSLPNAFSPNGDGYNDSFCIQGWDICTSHFSILVFNRWGEKVFESDDPSFCWDGTYKGRRLDAEVFIYTISASFSDGKQVNRKGNITLLD